MNAALEAETLVQKEIGKLAPHASLLPESQRSVAKSVHDQWMTHSGELLEKQWVWVHKLNKKMEQGRAVPEPAIEVRNDVSSILALFAKGASKLKYQSGYPWRARH